MTVDEERNKLPTVFATATFLHLDNRFFMITPAHALEKKHGKPVYIGVDPEPFSLAGRPIVKLSEIDIAAVELLGSEVDQVHESAIWVTDDLFSIRHTEGLSKCVLEGYPANINKMKNRKTKIEKNLIEIVLYDKDTNYFPDYVFKEFCHFAYTYNEKTLFDDTGKKLDARQLAGMSGGMFKRDLQNGLQLPLGIFLAQDNKKHALIGLNYQFILEWVKANINEFQTRKSSF